MASCARFDFRRVLTPVGFVWVPLAQVILHHGRQSIEVEMTIDSGADLSMIPLQVGLSLGLRKIRKPVRLLSGLSGGVPYVLLRLGFQLGPFRFRPRLAWAQVDDVPMLLGRTDVFSRFVIRFDERRRQVTFTQ